MSSMVRISALLNVAPPDPEPALEYAVKLWLTPTESYHPRSMWASGMSGLVDIILELVMDRERPA